MLCKVTHVHVFPDTRHLSNMVLHNYSSSHDRPQENKQSKVHLIAQAGTKA